MQQLLTLLFSLVRLFLPSVGKVNNLPLPSVPVIPVIPTIPTIPAIPKPPYMIAINAQHQSKTITPRMIKTPDGKTIRILVELKNET